MGERHYIRDPKGKRGGPGKWGACEEDIEDFEQEKQIQQWLNSQGRAGEVEFQHITSKGTVRNTLLKASVRLDERLSDKNGSGTFADLIAGSDGRTLECGGDGDEPDDEPLEKISRYLLALGFHKGELEWLIKIFKLSMQENRMLCQIFLNDSEW